MAEFIIRLSDERGHVTEQVEAARSEAEVRDRLLLQGRLVVGVKARGLILGGKVGLRQSHKIKLERFVQFNQQLVTLLRAGLPVLTSLDLLSRQQKDESFRGLLQNVRERVKSGELLSEAFGSQEAIPKIYTTTLLAGEKSGNLEEVLNRYVHFQRMALSFRKKLKASLIYPTLLVSMVVIMLTFLVTFVVPRFADLYSQLGAELPGITQFMLTLGVNAQHYALLLLLGVALLGAGLWHWAGSESGALWIDRLRLALPLVGPIWMKYQLSMFARMMATLLSGGLPLLSALQTAGASIQSCRLTQAVVEAAKLVREGSPLARSLEKSRRFPDLAVEMIEVGESTGALPQMLTSVAEFYEEDVEASLAAAMSLIEPVILIVMAIVVGVVLVSLYLPIFKLGTSGALQ
jgi:type IV pilus assembly protein PilC